MTPHCTFDLDRIAAETFVRNIVYEATMASTNDRARQLAAGIDGRPETPLETPCLVLTDRQTAGRGRGQHRWWSETGALTFSVLLREELQDLPAENWPSISLVTALAVIDALTEPMRPARLGLRWPNDVYADGRKICGILPERMGAASKTTLILGIGINVNNRTANGPPEVRSIASSMIEAAGVEFDLTDVLVRVLGQLQRRVYHLISDDPRLPVEWNERSLLTGQCVRLEVGSTAVEGTCRGIDATGRIMLETDDGLQAFASGTAVRSG